MEEIRKFAYRRKMKPIFKKVIGFLLIIIGLVALFTPFTPGSWLIFVGLEFIGLRMMFWDKIKAWLSAKGGSASGGQK